MTYFLFRRTVGFIFTLFTVSVVVFTVMNILPGDPALTILGLEASDDAIEALRNKLGLSEAEIMSKSLCEDVFGAVPWPAGASICRPACAPSRSRGVSFLRRRRTTAPPTTIGPATQRINIPRHKSTLP